MERCLDAVVLIVTYVRAQMSNVCYSKHSNSKKQKTRGRTKNLNASSGNKKLPCEIIES